MSSKPIRMDIINKINKSKTFQQAWAVNLNTTKKKIKEQFLNRGELFEGVAALTKFKGWTHTYQTLSTKFKAIDFYRLENGKNTVASLKTTMTKDVSTWISFNVKHLNDLKKIYVDKFVSYEGKSISNIGNVELHIGTHKQLTASELTTWLNAIRKEVGQM